jgi:hypothetical protein
MAIEHHISEAVSIPGTNARYSTSKAVWLTRNRRMVHDTSQAVMYSIPGTNVCMVHHNGSLANWKTVYDTAHQPSCSYAYHQPVHGTTYQPRSYAYEESGNGFFFSLICLLSFKIIKHSYETFMQHTFEHSVASFILLRVRGRGNNVFPGTYSIHNHDYQYSFFCK